MGGGDFLGKGIFFDFLFRVVLVIVEWEVIFFFFLLENVRGIDRFRLFCLVDFC